MDGLELFVVQLRTPGGWFTVGAPTDRDYAEMLVANLRLAHPDRTYRVASASEPAAASGRLPTDVL